MAALKAPNLFVTEPIPSGRVKLKTTHGPIEIELWPKETPKACRNFMQLCLEGYYDGVIFHRIVPGFIVQTGDPTGTGSGGESIYDEGVFDDEINARLKFTRRGLVAMANLSARNTNTSQFFITLDRTEELQGKHTIFGSVIGDTIYNVLKLSEAEIGRDERPVHPPVIKSVEVIDNPFPDILPRITTEQRKEQAKAKKEAKRDKAEQKMRSKHKVLAQNKGLLSFADEEQLTAPGAEDEEKRPKFRSAHDMDASSQLSNKIIDSRPSASDIPSSALMGPPQYPPNPDNIEPPDRQPVRMHTALKLAVKRHLPELADDVENPTAKEEAGLSMARRKGTKKDVIRQSDADKIKAEIAKMEADLKKDLTGAESESDVGQAKKMQKAKKQRKAEQGRSLLEAEQARYKARDEGLTSKDAAPKRKGASGGIELVLEGFRKKLRGADPLSNSGRDEAHRLDGYAGEVDPTQDGVLGDVDGDDEGWMSHELKFRKDATVDQHQADEYSVVDPLANKKFTLAELAARKSAKRSDESRGQELRKNSGIAIPFGGRTRDQVGYS